MASYSIGISGSAGNTKHDKITLMREHDGRRLLLEIDAPGVGAALGGEMDAFVRRELLAAAKEVQTLVESPSGLPISHYP